MTEETKETKQTNSPPVPDGIFTEAPASVNFFGVTRKGWNLQFTIRDWDEVRLLSRFIAFTTYLEEKGVSPKPVGQQPAPRPDPAYANGATTQVVPSPAPVQAGTNGSGQAHCIMLEIGTSYTGGKTQLSFVCDGLEHPLRFTKSMGEMVKLLAPLGYSEPHLVIGKKYSADFNVHYTESSKDGKTYKNVQSVSPRP